MPSTSKLRLSPIAKRRLVAEYLQATRNEIALDEHFLARSSIDPRELAYPPRASAWIALVKSRGRLVLTATRMARRMWRSLVAPMLFTLQYTLLLRNLPAASRPPEDLGRFTRFVVAFSSRAGDVIQPPHFPEPDACWITMPWATLSATSRGTATISVLDLLDRDTAKDAYRLAITSARLTDRDPSLSKWRLQTYTAFRWHLVRLAVSRLRGQLVIAEHYDRWAVLADQAACAQSRHRSVPAVPEPRLTIVQHGLVGAPTTDDAREHSLVLARRLRAVGALHVYDDSSESYFRSVILARNAAPEIRHFKPPIELLDRDTGGLEAILFVGHPVCESFHIALLDALKSKRRLKAFYKPHPLNRMGGDVARQDWEVVAGAREFPRVALLISYPSTLMAEYDGAGVPAVMHSLRPSLDLVDTVASEVCRALDDRRA